MKDELVRDGIDPDKIHVMYQWSQTEQAPDRCEDVGRAYGFQGKINIMFTGNMGTAQGLDTILDAASLVQEREDIQFLLVGAGVELDHLQSRVEKEGIQNVRFTGHVTHEEVQGLMQWADGLLVHLKRDPLFAITIPSKTQAYLAAGRPILCGVEGDGADLVSRTGGGICFPAENAYAMADAILELAEMSPLDRSLMAANSKSGYRQFCSQERLLLQYEMLFAEVSGCVLMPTLAVCEDVEDVPALYRAA